MIGQARIKVCGITRAADAATALAQGADFSRAEYSPRRFVTD